MHFTNCIQSIEQISIHRKYLLIAFDLIVFDLSPFQKGVMMLHVKLKDIKSGTETCHTSWSVIICKQKL